MVEGEFWFVFEIRGSELSKLSRGAVGVGDVAGTSSVRRGTEYFKRTGDVL